MGEYADAREDLPGWDAPGYDDGAWTPAAVLDRSTEVPHAVPDPPVRVTGELAPRAIDARPDGRLIVDCGQNMVGAGAAHRPGRRAGAPHPAAMLSGGDLYVENLRTAEPTDVYVAAGEPVEVFEPAFTFHGFRYAEITGYPGDLSPDDVTGRVPHSDTPFTGEFACSDEAVNRLHADIVWGQRGNVVAVPTADPGGVREGGGELAAREGIEIVDVRPEDRVLVVELASGRYSFRSDG